MDNTVFLYEHYTKVETYEIEWKQWNITMISCKIVQSSKNVYSMLLKIIYNYNTFFLTIRSTWKKVSSKYFTFIFAKHIRSTSWVHYYFDNKSNGHNKSTITGKIFETKWLTLSIKLYDKYTLDVWLQTTCVPKRAKLSQ